MQHLVHTILSIWKALLRVRGVSDLQSSLRTLLCNERTSFFVIKDQIFFSGDGSRILSKLVFSHQSCQSTCGYMLSYLHALVCIVRVLVVDPGFLWRLGFGRDERIGGRRGVFGRDERIGARGVADATPMPLYAIKGCRRCQ
jgi:hypothetical protein